MNRTEPKLKQRPGYDWLSSLSGRMALTFCTLSLLLLFAMQIFEMYGLPFGLFEGKFKETISQELEHLSTIADGNKNLLEFWLSERRADANVITKSPHLTEMAAAYRKHKADFPSPMLVEWLDSISYSYHYTSARILDPISGKTIADSSSRHDEPLHPAEIMNNARQPGHEETISYSAGSPGHPPHLHFIRQIGQEQSHDGTPAMLLDMTVDFETSVKRLWENDRTGKLGKTGETVVINNNHLFLTNTRHPLADGKPVIPLLTVNHAKPGQLAVEGSDGTAVAADYRGVKVLAAYRHIPLNPETSWGMVVKIDEKEALEPVHRQLKRAVFYMALASVITLISTILLARRLTRPLQRIASTAMEIESGDLTQRVALTGTNETIALGKSFNTMVERLVHSQESLEQKVKDRTEELLKLTNRQKALLAAVPDIIMEVDINRVYTWGNRAGIEFFGDDVIGSEAALYFEGEQDTYQKTQPLLDGTADVLYVESWQRRRDGQIRLLAWWCKAFVNDQGTVTGTLSTARDITELKHAEDEKIKLESQLFQAQKMESIGRLAGGVAHDFNNMLSVIMGHAELGLMRLEPTHRVCVDLKEISKTAERSADLTRQLLAFARKQTVAPKIIDLNDTITNMLKMLQRLIGEDIYLTWQPSPELWPVRIDPSQIDQILANLCVNARDAIENTGRITIETTNCNIDTDYCANNPEASPGEFVRLGISDNGRGMDRETQLHIFEPFYTTKELGKGTGLGLATVYGAVRQNNGFINIYSEPGRGTTLSIYLPRYTGSTLEQPTDADLPIAARGQETILLVEDEPAILNITLQMLEKQGYTVLKAATPGEALQLARDHQGEIHLLMTDVIMPEMNGRDLAENLLTIYPKIKKLFMSGYTSDIIANHGVLENWVHFIQKPFSLADMAAKVREVLDEP